jgi:hypothetical protein
MLGINIDTMNVQDQQKRAAQIQRTWAKLAFNDEEYNLKQAARDRSMGNNVLAEMHEHEAAIDRYWGNRRLKSANGGKRV